MESDLRERLVSVLGEYVVDKREALQAGFELMPRFVTEFLLAKARAKGNQMSVRDVRERMRRHWVDADRRGEFISRLMRDRAVTLIALLDVEPRPHKNKHIARIAQIDGSEIAVSDDLPKRYPELLYGGLWGSCSLTYDPDTNPKRPEIRVVEFAPYQLTKPNMDLFKEARRRFSTEEWIEVLITSAGYRPAAFPTLRQRFLVLSRLVPLVQPNVNLIELGPRGTGKSYLLRNLSPRVYLVAGARATPAALLYDLQKKAVGIVGRKKVVVFDEIGATTFPDRSLVAALKDFMESGTISRGGRQLVSDCSLLFTGNLDIGADGRPSRDYLHLFEALPRELSDTAVGDRIHGFIPGWELPKISDDVLADGVGFLSDYFGEVLGGLRREVSFLETVRSSARLENATIRDKHAIERLAAGMLKLLYPDGRIEDDGLHRCLELAIDLRSRVHQQLERMAPGEFRAKRISFPGMGESRAPDLGPQRSLEERDIEANHRDVVGRITILLVGERGGGDVGFVECAHVDGRGQPTVTGLRGPVLDQSVRASYDALLHLGTGLGLSPNRLAARRMSVHLVNMAEGKEGPSAGLAIALAMYSAATGRPIRRGLAVTGELSVHGHVGAIGGVLEKLHAAARHGRSLVLIPSANAAELSRAPELLREMRVEPVATLEAAIKLAFDVPGTDDEPLVADDDGQPSLVETVTDEPPPGQRLLALLTEDLAPEALPALAADVRDHAERIARSAAEPNGRLAASLAAALVSLLEIYLTLEPRHRGLVVGTARYFVQQLDERNDLDPGGLDDDIEVFNWVVRQIGRPELMLHG